MMRIEKIQMNKVQWLVARTLMTQTQNVVNRKRQGMIIFSYNLSMRRGRA